MAAWKNCLGPDTDVHVLANQKNSSRTVDGSLSLEETDYVTKLTSPTSVYPSPN